MTALRDGLLQDMEGMYTAVERTHQELHSEQLRLNRDLARINAADRPVALLQPRRPPDRAPAQAAPRPPVYPVAMQADLNAFRIELTNMIVDARANKTQIKKAIKNLYQVKAAKCNTLITPQGLKKAYVRLAPVHDALDVANKIGIL